MKESEQLALAPRHMGAVNWLGLWTLYAKEVRRFLNVYLQTIAAPVVTRNCCMSLPIEIMLR